MPPNMYRQLSCLLTEYISHYPHQQTQNHGSFHNGGIAYHIIASDFGGPLIKSPPLQSWCFHLLTFYILNLDVNTSARALHREALKGFCLLLQTHSHLPLTWQYGLETSF